MLKRIFALLSAEERRRAVLVVAAALVFAAVEVAGIGGIAAYVALMANPDVAMRSPWAADVQRWTGLTNIRDFMIAASLALLALILVRNLISAFVLWIRLDFLHATRHAMAVRLLSYYLTRPFSFFLRANSAALTKNIAVEVNTLITTCLFSWIMLISDVVMGVSIFGLLVWQEPFLTLTAIGAVGLVAAMVPVLTRRQFRTLGPRNRELNEGLFKTTNEAIGGIKEIKLLGREAHFVNQFRTFAQEQKRINVLYMLWTDGPRYLLEVLVTGGLVLAVVVALIAGAEPAALAGTAALFAVAAYRLMPLAHRLLSSVAGLQFNRSVLDALADGLAAVPAQEGARAAEPMPFRDRIAFRDVRFRYEQAASHALDGVSFEVPRDRSVAFVGPTGAGKSTLVDLLIGVHHPTDGTITIDGVPLTEANAAAWQANIGYVPQHVFLLDDTIRRNIALGMPDHEIDDQALREAARMAHVEEFVLGLADGFDTRIGERGVRLSGGQRQRIGIARALYRRARVLVLDEATSALDGITEAVIEQAIEDLAGTITVVIIAHRLTTVRRCNVIHLMEAGRIVASGTFDELMRDNSTFRAMARAAE